MTSIYETYRDKIEALTKENDKLRQELEVKTLRLHEVLQLLQNSQAIIEELNNTLNDIQANIVCIHTYSHS